MISVFGSLVDEEEIANVAACMRSQWMGFGGMVTQFEERFSKQFDVPNFAMVDSGSNALFLAVTLLNLPKGSDVILPSFTWVSCAQAVLLAGHRPVFCDVDPVTHNVRVEDIEAARTPNTRAVMVVHYAGLPVDIDPIIELGLPVIEDAAHAVVSKHKGRHCGSIGDVGIYSFDAVKNLTTGEGGGVASKHADYIARAKKLRYCGIGKSGFEAAASGAKGKSRWWEYDISEAFIKMLPNNIAASIGLAQLDRLESLQRRREQIWQAYQTAFASHGWITRPADAPAESTHSYFTYCIRAPQRDALAHFLLDNGVYTTLRYHPLHLNPLYGQTGARLPVSEMLNEEGLSIPLHPRLTDEEVGKVTQLVIDFGKREGL